MFKRQNGFHNFPDVRKNVGGWVGRPPAVVFIRTFFGPAERAREENFGVSTPEGVLFVDLRQCVVCGLEE